MVQYSPSVMYIPKVSVCTVLCALYVYPLQKPCNSLGMHTQFSGIVFSVGSIGLSDKHACSQMIGSADFQFPLLINEF